MIQLAVIGCYLVLLVSLGYLASRFFRGTSSDYMLASHSIGPVLLLMSLFGTTMTAFALVGSTGVSYRQGVGIYGELASAAGIMHSLCFLIIGVPIWRLGRKHGFRTQIQFFRARFENNFIGYLLFPILVGFVITYLLVGVVGGGAVVQQVSKGAFASWGWFADVEHALPRSLASGAICLVVLAYVFMGGMRGTAWANAFQTAFFMVLGIVTFVSIANSMGGTPSLWENLRIATETSPAEKRSMQSIQWSVYLSYLLIPISVGMFPHIFQHWLTARSASSFKLPIIMHPIFVMIVWAPCVLIGVWANSDLARLPANTGTNEVLATLVTLHTGALVGGLLSAGILAAIMSSLDSQFLCLGTMFTDDIVRNLTKEQITEQRLVWVARAFVVAVVVTTFCLSLVLPATVFDLGIWSFTGFTGLFPLVFAAIYWRRVTAAGAIASILVTAITWWVLFYRSQFGAVRNYTFPEEPLAWGLIEIPVMLPIVAVTVCSTITLVAVSLITKPPCSTVVDKFFSSHQSVK
ncbi:MAG TPA: sodium:solute symporter family protein [Pirellulaceae bacterium]|nr:sodium:solute symporter family protein [Pirellulaceae bacterium]